MRITALILTLLFFVTGCATAPPMPQFETAQGDRVGVLVEAGDALTHTHIGTTIFNNFVKTYPYNWNLKTDVKRSVEESLKRNGFVPVDLQAEGVSYESVSGLIQASDKSWQVAPGKEETLRRLQNQLRLKAIIVLKETRVMAALECTGGPCAERYSDTSGLYTRSFIFSPQYFAIAAYQWHVYVLDPAADTALTEPIWSMLRIPSTPLKGFKEPADFKNMTEAELSPVKEAILQFTGKVADQAVKSLNPK